MPISASKWLIEELKDDYAVFPLLADLCEFGVPQRRKRTFLTFLRRDEAALAILREKAGSPYPIPRCSPEYNGRPVTLREALASFNLPSLDARCAETAISLTGNGLHSVPIWADRRYEMVAAIPPHGGGSAWENDDYRMCGHVDADENDAVCPRCKEPLLRPVVKGDGTSYRLVTGFRSSTYARMKSDAPACTITTASGHLGSNNTIHPFENRLMSTFECALLQTLPRKFKWGTALKRWGHTNVRSMIGEAVPPLFTTLHGRVLRALLENKNSVRLYPMTGIKCSRPAKTLERFTFE